MGHAFHIFIVVHFRVVGVSGREDFPVFAQREGPRGQNKTYWVTGPSFFPSFLCQKGGVGVRAIASNILQLLIGCQAVFPATTLQVDICLVDLHWALSLVGLHFSMCCVFTHFVSAPHKASRALELHCLDICFGLCSLSTLSMVDCSDRKSTFPFCLTHFTVLC